MTFTRLQTSRSRLQILWQSPSDLSGAETLETAVDCLVRRAGGKPILINRETESRDPKVAKLYKEALASERFALAAHWFHCVRVGDDVLDEGHPLHALFAGSSPAALVLMSADGKKQVPFLGTTQQRVSWPPIAKMLADAYEKDGTVAVKGLEKLLCTFDRIDGEQNELDAQLARATKKRDGSKIAAIQQKLASLDVERQQVLAEEKALRELVLRAQPTGG